MGHRKTLERIGEHWGTLESIDLLACGWLGMAKSLQLRNAMWRGMPCNPRPPSHASPISGKPFLGKIIICQENAFPEAFSKMIIFNSIFNNDLLIQKIYTFYFGLHTHNTFIKASFRVACTLWLPSTLIFKLSHSGGIAMSWCRCYVCTSVTLFGLRII